jgi:uncharacterized repeat protein (TIGR01451 family)
MDGESFGIGGTVTTGDTDTITVPASCSVAPIIPVATSTVITPTAPGGSVGSGNNNNGGRYVPNIGIVKIPTPLTLPAGSGSVTYNYTVWNVGGQQPLDNITVTDDKCSPITYVSGDVNGNGKIDPHEKWKYTCTATLSTTTTNTAIATGYSDDAYHQAAIATAVATVAVGSSLTPPIINLVKLPSRLTPFPFGGGNVTYTYTVTNPGVVAMNNISVTDNKCGSVSYVSGDVNGNNLLDPGEEWIYTCETNVPVTTMNSAATEGSADGFTATGYAFATVLVSAPGLPNTGFPPEGSDGVLWDVVALIIGFLVLTSSLSILILKKRNV